MERLDYIQSLGVNAIELMPIHEFNELEYYQVGRGGGCVEGGGWGGCARLHSSGCPKRAMHPQPAEGRWTSSRTVNCCTPRQALPTQSLTGVCPCQAKVLSRFGLPLSCI